MSQRSDNRVPGNTTSGCPLRARERVNSVLKTEFRKIASGYLSMALALMYPEAEKSGRRKNGLFNKPLEVNKGYLSMARTILKHPPDP